MENLSSYFKDQMRKVCKRQTELVALTETENRTWNAQERAEYEALDANYAEAKENLEQQEELDTRAAHMKPRNTLVPGSQRNPQPRPEDREPPQPTGYSFRSDDGTEFRALAHGDHMATHGEELHIGRIVRAMCLGDQSGLNEWATRAMLGSSDTAGGFLLNPQLSSSVIDVARSASVAFKAGEQVLPMETSELALAKLTSDSTAYWRDDNVAVTGSAIGFGRITLRPKTLAVLIPMSVELLEDSVNAASVIQQVVGNVLGQNLDEAILVGDGAGATPVGIRNTTGVNAIGSVGAPADWSNPSAAITDILKSNYPGEINGLSWIQHPTLGGLFDAMQDTTGQPMRPSPWVEQLQRCFTTAMPSTEGGGSNEFAEIIDDFSQCIVGMRTSGVSFEVLSEGSITDSDRNTYNATSQIGRIVRARLRADVAMMQPSWFTVTSGITTS